MNLSAKRRVCGAGGDPRIANRIVSPASIDMTCGTTSAPHDHFFACPDCRVRVSAIGCIGGVDSSPSVRARIVSPAGVQPAAVVISTPDDHFFASPDRRVSEPGARRIGSAHGSPTVCAGIVSPASVQAINAISGPAPDDQFTAGPHCGREHSAIGRARGAGGCPRVVSARRTACKNIARALRVIYGGVSSLLLSEHERDHKGRQEQKQVKRASNNIRLTRRRILFFHKPAFKRGEGSF